MFSWHETHDSQRSTYTHTHLLLPTPTYSLHIHKFRRREGVTLQSSGDVPCDSCSNLPGTSPAIFAQVG